MAATLEYFMFSFGRFFIFFIYFFSLRSHDVGKPHLLSSPLVTWGQGHSQASLQTNM